MDKIVRVDPPQAIGASDGLLLMRRLLGPCRWKGLSQK
jgi:hypothetical protein